MRALIVVSIAVIGAGVGAALDAAWAAAGGSGPPILWTAGLLVGLAVGVLVARLAYPRRPSARRDRGLDLMARHRRQRDGEDQP